MGRAFDTFRETLHLAREARPGWFFELTPSNEAAARTLDDHDVDVIVAPGAGEWPADGEAMTRRSRARRIAVFAQCEITTINAGQDASIHDNTPASEQLAVLDRMLTPWLQQSA